MLVRLRNYDRDVIGEAQAPLRRIAFRAFRHDGMLYERVADGVDGMPEYRATERTHTPPPRTVTVINHAGSVLGTVVVEPGWLPSTVTFQGVSCPLWTTKDQSGQVLYLKPEATDGV